MSGIEQMRKAIRRMIRQDVTSARRSTFGDALLMRREVQRAVKPLGANLSLTEIVIRVGAALALTVAIVFLIFFAFLFVLGTG